MGIKGSVDRRSIEIVYWYTLIDRIASLINIKIRLFIVVNSWYIKC